jgi:hypothetical protein
MSTYTSEPGTLLAGRYRLVGQVHAGAGWTYWKATDEILARPVTVLTFAAGCPRVAAAVAAARAASRLGDPRFSQVFDVEDADEQAYVVLEWVAGESLLDMLSDGPLEAGRAVMLVSEAAQALAAAHAAGLTHLRLDPSCLHWTRGGVKVTGLGISAALAGTAPASGGGSGDPAAADPAAADARGLGGLLYAALTGYWPCADGPAEPGGLPAAGGGLLPPAPQAGRTPFTPRQVSAAVPAVLDDITCRALFQRPTRHGQALSTPAALAEALAEVAPAAAMPVPPPARPAGPQADGSRREPPAGPVRADLPYRTARQRPAAGRALASAVIVVVLAAVGIVAWSISRGAHHAAAPSPAGRRHPSAPSAAATLQPLKPASANSFDVYGNDGGNEDGAGAHFAIAGISGKFWHTDYYLNYPKLGNLKPGTGLILDMGEQVKLSQVTVQFGPICCAHVQIEIGNDDNPVPSALHSFTTVARSAHAAGTTTFDAAGDATGRYVLIWITDLPRMAGTTNRYQAQIYNVVVRGSAASQSG